jgi:BirA family biotin operon repressor/biotin-[acetyl-CoA-carboxylase] ligase
MDEDFGPGAIRRAVHGRLGRPIRWLEVTGSTNSDALDWAAAGGPEGALVVAGHQRAGRGRRGRGWVSEPGRSLLFSLILRPELPADRVALLTTAMGVACAEGIEMLTGLPSGTKWPNDVTVGGRKLAGILVETRGSRSDAGLAIAGVGINVYWSREEFPESIAESATSVAAEMDRSGLGPPPGRAEILASVLSSLEDVYPIENPEGLIERAAERSTVLSKEVTVRFADGRSLRGEARRLLEDGSLEVVAEGSAVVVRSGEIEALRGPR